VLPDEIRRRAEDARRTARRLIKDNRQFADRADVLMREAEAAIAALRGDDDALPLRARRSRTSRQTDADGFGERWTGAGRFGEALQNLLPASRSVEPERDTPVGIDPLELAGRRIALGPSRIRQLLLRRVRDGAGPEEDRETARRDSDRSQRRR
jgi:hypothetical protein